MLLRFELAKDARGTFVEYFNTELFDRLGIPAMTQANTSFSWQGIARGMHFQTERPQGKLVSVSRGCIQDVAMDMRAGSPTLGSYVSVMLYEPSPDAMEMLWVPPGFAHGFLAINNSQVNYLCSTHYDPKTDAGIHPLKSGVHWNTREFPQISEKDNQLPSLVDYLKSCE